MSGIERQCYNHLLCRDFLTYFLYGIRHITDRRNRTGFLTAGMNIIERALHGETAAFAFLLKILFTALTIGAGFKGGEIVPSFFTGATFGCLFAILTSASAPLCAAIGMVSVFCGVTNCPITALLISFELFGFDHAYYYLIAIAVSYMLSGYYSLYHAQTIVYSKFENSYVNRRGE